MLGQRDKVHFDKVWERKLNLDQQSFAYKPGANLRVDKALQIISPGHRLLDIGCGTGILAAQARGKFQEVYGVDIAEAAIEIAREHDVLASVVNLNAESLPYENTFFDAITILSAFQCMYDLDMILRECFRVLKPCGELLISVPNMRAVWRLFRLAVLGYFPRTSLDAVGYDGGALHYFCFRNLVELLERRGFETVDSYGIFCLPRFARHLPDRTIIGAVKREFFSAEILLKSLKNQAN